jgi:transcriptional regulator with XRE-family HTH domain
MSYQMRIDPKSRKAARFISSVQKKIQKALADSGKTQQEIATILGVDRSVVNRRLKGSANLTARSIGEFAYALDKDVKIEFTDRSVLDQANWATISGTFFEVQPKKGTIPTGTINPNEKFKLERSAS